MASLQKLTDKPWRLAGTVAAVAVTTAAGGVAWATSSADTASPSPSPSASPSAPADPAKPDAGKRGERGAFGAALHGEYTVEKDGGGYQTIATQQGEVTAVSTDSITLKSADGYSRAYTVTAETLVNAARDGIASIKTGNTVSVLAVVADGKATATSIDSGTARDAANQKWGLKRGPR